MLKLFFIQEWMVNEVKKCGDSSNNCWIRWVKILEKTFSKLCFVKYLESMRWWYFTKPFFQFTSKSDESYHLREKYFQKSNSHSQTKRPEPSDGFLKYLEDEVSGRIADMEHPQCAEAIWYGATTEKGEQWKDTTKFKIWKMFCCLKQQSQNLLVQLCPPVFPFWQKNRQEGPGINLNVWAQTRLGFRIFTIT